MRTLKRLLAGAVLVAAVATPTAITASPAGASSACDYSSRAGSPLLGGYVYVNGVAYRSSCSTVVRPQRLSGTQVNFSGWMKDTATDHRNSVLLAQFRVNGNWGSPQIIENSGVESWHTWSFPVRAAGYVDMMYVRACAWTAAGGVTACGDPSYVYGF